MLTQISTKKMINSPETKKKKQRYCNVCYEEISRCDGCNEKLKDVGWCSESKFHYCNEDCQPIIEEAMFVEEKENEDT